MAKETLLQDNHSSLWGYVLGSLAAISYGMNPLFALPLLNAGIDAQSVLMLRYLTAIPMLAVIMLASRKSFKLTGKQWPGVIVMGLFMAFSSLGLYLSYAYIGASIASVLLFIYPILVAVIMTVGFHEHTSWRTVICIILATVGIGLLYRGEGGVTLNAYGLLLVFVSALTYAIYLVGVNRPPLRGIPSLKMTFYVISFGVFLFVPFASMSCFDILSAQPMLWLNVAGMAFFPTAFSLICTSAAISRIGSTPVAILGALEPVTAVAIAVTIFDESLTTRLVTGMALVIVAVTMIIAKKR